MSPSVALENLGKKEIRHRDPAAPFEVSSALMMAYTGYGSRDPHQPFAVASIGGGQQPASPTPPDPTLRLDLPPGQYQGPPDPYQPRHMAPSYQPAGVQYGQAPAPITQNQRTFLCVAGIASFLGGFMTMALPWLLLAGGGLALRANKAGRQIGVASLITGALLALVVIARMYSLLNGLGRWISLSFGIAYFATAFSSAQR
jgi:hypothetical protein